MDAEPRIGDRHVVIRVAAVEVGLDYAGPYFVEEWDGSRWRDIGRATTKDDLRNRFDCEPPNIASTPRYANSPEQQ
jgi:hypothetical protein